MENTLKTGMHAKLEIKVENKHTASALGSGGIDVLATPMMIALMEGASMKAVQPSLADNESTVGTLVNVTHTAATPVGMNAWAQGKLVQIDGKRLVFEVSAYDESGLIGEGMHERFIINVDRFIQKANSKSADI